MSQTTVQTLLADYENWLRDKTTLSQATDGWTTITTPSLDRHNDRLQIHAKVIGDEVLLSDDGYILSDLELSGCSLESPKRKELLAMTLRGFGIENTDGALRVKTTAASFPRRKHDLLQAMLAVNDMFVLAAPLVTSLFYEDVQAWLDDADIRYTERPKFAGRMGYDHQFDFVIPKSRKAPERILQAINRPTKDMAEATVMKWVDTKDARPATASAYAILNDQETHVAKKAREAMTNYDIKVFTWSKRDALVKELAA